MSPGGSADELGGVSSRRAANTPVSLMLASGIPVHSLAAWHGHDRSTALLVWTDAQSEYSNAPGPFCSGEC